jgi:hypothetical protein
VKLEEHGVQVYGKMGKVGNNLVLKVSNGKNSQNLYVTPKGYIITSHNKKVGYLQKPGV